MRILLPSDIEYGCIMMYIRKERNDMFDINYSTGLM